MLGWLRIAWRLQRWELAFVAAACAGLAAAAGLLAVDMRSVLAACDPAAADAVACTSPYRFQDSHGSAVSLLTMLATVLPFGIGLVLGVPMVAREVEHRTAHLSWALAGSRLRWLAWRAAPVAVVALLLVSLPAVAVDQMLRARWANSDLGLLEFGAHGVPLVTRTGLALGMGLLIGALIGRLLPALLVGIGLSVAASVGLDLLAPLWMPAEPLPAVVQGDERLGARWRYSVYRAPDGAWISEREARALEEAAHVRAGSAEPDPASLPEEVGYGTPSHRYPDVVVRESAALAVAALGLMGAAGLLVHRRRPG